MSKALLLRTFSIAAVLCAVIALPASAGVGQALYERWAGSGTADSMLTESSVPDYTEILTSTEWGVGDDNALSDYRGRITAWIIPPVTGEYIFWIVTDDNGCLWLSSDHDPANAQLIALESTWAGENEWGVVGDEAQSSPIRLQGGKPYWFRGGYQEGGGGDHIRIAWASNDAGIADHTIIEGKYLLDTNPFFASLPKPADGAVNIKVEDIQLSWQAPLLVTDAAYAVYFGTDPNELLLLDSDLNEPAVNAGDRQTDTTYLWRVDVLDPNEGGNPVVNAGPLWSFTTTPASPIIFDQPQEILVFAGETARLEIDAYSANQEPLTYQWFKDTEPNLILSYVETLTIDDAQIEDEAVYKCKLTNAFGSVTSDPMFLAVKRLIGHWPFEENLEDVEGENDGYTKNPDYDEGIIGDYAVKFGLHNSNSIEIPTAAHKNLSWTLSFWENASPEIFVDYWEIMVASGAPYGYEFLDVGRYQATKYYIGIMETSALPDYYYWPSSVFSLARDEWNHFVITFDAMTKQAVLYVNNIPRTEFNVDFTGFDELLFVGNSREDEYPYYGLIDDLRFYNYALDALEIAHLYTDVVDEKFCIQRPPADVSGPKGKPDCVVNMYDLVELADAWLECNRVPAENCL